MLKHWLGFLVLACFFGVGLSSMAHNNLAAMTFAGWFVILLAVFVLRGIFRLTGSIRRIANSKDGR